MRTQQQQRSGLVGWGAGHHADLAHADGFAFAAMWPELATVNDLRPDIFGPAPTDTQEAA